MSEKKNIDRREFLKRFGIGAAALPQLWLGATQKTIR